jgi:hypothetical protein
MANSYPDLGKINKELNFTGKLDQVGVANIARAISIAAQCSSNPNAPGCTGELDIGMFFDGTGNNEKEDYGSRAHPKPFEQRKHSNVCRLYHAFPDERDTETHPKVENDHA